LLNAISAVRTGFRGTDLGFGYTLPEAPVGTDRSRTKVMEAMVAATSGLTLPTPSGTPSPLSILDATRPRLFPNERLVSLPALAYFYAYSLSVRAGYAARRVSGPSLSVLSRVEHSPSIAERSPRQFDMPQPRLSVLSPRRLKFDVYLGRHADFVTADEQRAMP